MRPAEVLLPEGVEPPPWLDAALNVTRVEPLWFDADLATVDAAANTSALPRREAFGIDRASAAVAACGAALMYLRENQAASSA